MRSPIFILLALFSMLALVLIGAGCSDRGNSVQPAANITVSVAPTSVSVYTGAMQQFDATVSGTANTTVTWNASSGSVNGNGLYTAPATPGTYYVTATSVADPSKSSTAEVVVSSPPLETGVAISPQSVVLDVNTTQLFTATLTNLDPGVTWEVDEGTAGGEIDATGLYTAPNDAGTYHVTVTSTDDPTKSATAVITVNPVVAVIVSPGSVSIYTGATQQFSATVTGTANTAVTWNASSGSVDGNGFYTAPAIPGTYYVTATSVADPGKSFTAEVIVSSPPLETGVAISPQSVILDVNTTEQFTAILTNLDPGVTWSVDEGITGGSITNDGLYTAPNVAGTYHVTVTSTADPTKSATATVTVVPIISISITPKVVHLLPGETKQFNYHLMGATINTVTWSVIEADGGTITDTGLYTAPATAISGMTFHVSVASTQNPTRKELATVVID